MWLRKDIRSSGKNLHQKIPHTNWAGYSYSQVNLYVSRFILLGSPFIFCLSCSNIFCKGHINLTNPHRGPTGNLTTTISMYYLTLNYVLDAQLVCHYNPSYAIVLIVNCFDPQIINFNIFLLCLVPCIPFFVCLVFSVIVLKIFTVLVSYILYSNILRKL